MTNKMWPPKFGYLYWLSLIHSSAAAVRHRDLTPVESDLIEWFFKNLHRFVPCPDCRMHCYKYTERRDFHVKTGEEYYLLGFEFHNAVNLRTGKLALTKDESLKALDAYLQDYDCSLDKISDSFHLGTWMVIVMMTQNMVKYNEDGEPEEADPASSEMMVEMLKCLSQLMAFSINHDDRKSRMLQVLDRPLPKTLEEVRRMVAAMYNSVGDDFGAQRINEAALTGVFNRMMTDNMKGSDLSRAHQIRVEDHARMSEMQNKLIEQETPGTSFICWTTVLITSMFLLVSVALNVTLVYKLTKKNVKKLKPSKSYQEGRFPSSAPHHETLTHT